MGSGEEGAAKTEEEPPTRNGASPSPEKEPGTPLTEWGPPPLRAFYSPGCTVAATPQAYFPPPPVAGASPGHHYQYHWGGQHILSPYGTPIPFPHIYTHGGAYPHPGDIPITVAAAVDIEAGDGVQHPSSKKRAKGTIENAAGKLHDNSKSTSGSAEDDASQSEHETSSEDINEHSGQLQEFSAVKRSADRTLVDEASQHVAVAKCSSSSVEQSCVGKTARKLQVLAPGRAVLHAPPTNLNIGMDLWANPQLEASLLREGSNVMVSDKGVMPELQWVPDERELKRQKRKQSNRESARRSRQRKQQECEDLGRRVDQLTGENSALRNKIEQFNKDCKELEAENLLLTEELTRLYGRDAVSALDGNHGGG